jgi:tellurite resistance protein
MRVTANLFGMPFAFAGLAQCWWTAHELAGVPSWPAQVLWILAAAVYLLTLAGYLRTARPLAAEPGDLTFGPFTALILVVPMMLGLALAVPAPAAGRTIFFIFAVLVALYGGWLSGQWIIEDMPLARWHPGYFLPTVAGPLLAAGGSAALGYDGFARLMLGYGLLCWIILGSIILVRLFTQPALPTPLLPTLAVELAPPVVAGSAWFQINGNRPDTAAYLLAGYAVLMVLVQLRLIQLYVKVPFAGGFWAFGFSYIAAFTAGIHWLTAADAPGQRALTYTCLAIVTAGMAALSIRTVIALRQGKFFPRPSGAAS